MGPDAVGAIVRALGNGACPDLRCLNVRLCDAGDGIGGLGDVLRCGALPRLERLSLSQVGNRFLLSCYHPHSSFSSLLSSLFDITIFHYLHIITDLNSPPPLPPSYLIA